MQFPFRSLLGLGLLGSCAAPRALPPGTYLQTKPNTVLFTSRELVVYPDGRIQYLLHTDDRSMSRQGNGTYRLRGHRLELHLQGRPDTATARVTSTPLPPQDQRLRFYVGTAAPTSTSGPLQGFTVLVRNAAGQVLTGAATAADGYVELPWAPAVSPQTIEISGIGWQRLRRPWPAGPATFRVQLVPEPYEPYALGTRKTFGVLAVSAQQLVLRQGTDTLIMVRQP